jgi:hypothetical protein
LTLPQRAPTEPSASAAPAAPSGVSGGPVKIHRDRHASDLSTALDARSFTHGGEIFLPASHGPLTSGTGMALLAHELTHVTQQRRLGSSLPPEHSANGRTLEAEAVAAERSPDLPLATAGHGTATAAATSGPSGTSADLMGSVSATESNGSGPQRAPAQGGAARSAGASSRTQTGGASSGSSGHTHSEQELEVLAHQLYHRIGRHLRRELLVDRERIGFALDLP